ncbi:MAG TPA: iron-sulfur cluster assembly scaffold protein [Desulfohalobiaceae bacterium]|nr:iron-sulfur cluster assembly scaffold protein [Desulfohalobiaceae bacterium]
MTDPFDNFVTELQDQIFQQTKDDYGHEFYERWQNPKYMGQIEKPNTKAELTGSCGDKIEILLDIQEDKISQAAFHTTGCAPSIVCASVACELSENKDLEEAASMEAEDILKILPKLPEENHHCAHLAAHTVREAIRKYWQKKST